jgi:hypothetical protein
MIGAGAESPPLASAIKIARGLSALWNTPIRRADQASQAGPLTL